MALVIYDMDETLLNADASTLWIEYLVEQGMADAQEMFAQEQRLMEQYRQGNLDVHDYVAMQLKPNVGMTLEELQPHIERYIDQKIRPVIRDDARSNIAEHKAQGARCLVISASTTFLVAPIAKEVGIDDVIGIDIHLEDERIVGTVKGVPSYREGKVTRLRKWLQQESEQMSGSWFYTDSHNDLPLLEQVCNPVAVNADDKLVRLAEENGWQQVLW